MDLSHLAYLHTSTTSNGLVTTGQHSVEQHGNTVH
jgi:hypothetical protein